jgi:hypothetical protein
MPRDTSQSRIAQARGTGRMWRKEEDRARCIAWQDCCLTAMAAKLMTTPQADSSYWGK